MSEEKIEPTSVTEGTDRTVSLRLTDVNTKWRHYGGLEEGTLLMGKAGSFTKSRIKLIYRNPVTEDPIEPIHAASPDYTLYPNEEMERLLSSEWGAANGFKLHDRGASRTGNALFLTFVAQDDYNGSYFIEGDDYIQLGFAARNSIDGSVGFGLDAFTYRGLCWNGCIRDSKETASIYRKHTKHLADFVANLSSNLGDIMEASSKVVAYYRQLAKVELNLDLATALAEPATRGQLPKKYLPFAWEIDNSTGKATGSLLKKDGQPVLLYEPMPVGLPATPQDRAQAGKMPTMWQIQNNITQAIWHATGVDMQSKYGYMQTAMNTLEKVIEPLEITAPVARRVA